MPHMLLIVEPTGQRADRGREGGEQAYAQMLAYTAELRSRGILVASNSLASPALGGVRLQVRDGQRRVVDGPFTEAKEMVGGFFLIDVEDREQAIALAAECPAAQWATVEVRRVGPCFEG